MDEVSWHKHPIADEHVCDELIGQVVLCSECGARVMVEWDETYDPETGDSDDWFYYADLIR